MRLPEPPQPKRFGRISPTLYENLLACPAKAVWSASSDRSGLAPHPLALLGTCFHGVMEAMHDGLISGSDDECRVAAREHFDRLAHDIHARAHPLILVKFPTPQKMPYYNLLRERAALLASEQCGQPTAASRADPSPSQRFSERRFTSADGLIVGRPDFLDASESELFDYKTGPGPKDAMGVSDREARQLRLYVFLAMEAGIAVSRATIVRGDGEANTIEVSPDSAQTEARQAREVLQAYNDADAAKAFFEIARPHPESCRMCPCIPLCEPFWRAADPSWQDSCGVHIEGAITAVDVAVVQGTPLISVTIEVSRGTVDGTELTAEQIPVAWTTADGDRPFQVGDLIRIVDGRLTNSDAPVVARADRTMTSLWRVEPSHD